MSRDIIDQFKAAMRNAGIEPPEHIVADGVLHRFSTNGKAGDTSGWYVLHTDGVAAGSCGCWRLGIKQNWRANIGRPYTPEEDAAHREFIASVRRQQEADTAANHEQAATHAADIWERAQPAPADHPYLARKGIKPHGTRALNGTLLVPMVDTAGKLWNLERIAGERPADGAPDKKGLKGGRRTGLFFTLGELSGASSVCVAEGFATGASIHEATSLPVAVAFNAGNLEPVAMALQRQYPDARLAICGDDDYRTPGNPGKTKATQAARSVGGIAVSPTFSNPRPDGATDFNDLARAEGMEATSRIIFTAVESGIGMEEKSENTVPADGSGGIADGFQTPEPIGDIEWEVAELTARCIVRDLFYADVALLNAAGGTGKTTLLLYEAVHVALGLSLYGLEVMAPGSVVIVTAEDNRERLVARLREVCKGMDLTPEQIRQVRRDVRISDVSGKGMKLTTVVDDVVMPSGNVAALIDALGAIAPAVIWFDPAVSFGTGESRVNDGPQGLVEAARRVRNELDCMAGYLQHTGQQAARDQTADQYAGRGGSAFPDGSRMVRVLNLLTPEQWRQKTGTDLGEGESGLEMSLPKNSYCAPNRQVIYLRRAGYVFTMAEAVQKRDMESENAAIDNQVFQLITNECQAGKFPNKDWCEKSAAGVSQRGARDSITRLLHDQKIELSDVPNRKRGGATRYLRPLLKERGDCSSKNSGDGNEESPKGADLQGFAVAGKPADSSSLPYTNKGDDDESSPLMSSSVFLVGNESNEENEEYEESTNPPPNDPFLADEDYDPETDSYVL